MMLLNECGQESDFTKGADLINGFSALYVVGDKGYDSDAIVEAIESEGGEAVIPPRSHRKEPRPYDKALYIVLAELNERFDIGRLPELKRQTVKPREAILEAMKAQNETKGKSSVYLHYKLRAAAHLSANTFKVEMRTLIEDGKVMAFPRYHGGIEYRLISA